MNENEPVLYWCPVCGTEIQALCREAPGGTACVRLKCARCTPDKATWAGLEFLDIHFQPIGP
jgi:hypothetical protein